MLQIAHPVVNVLFESVVVDEKDRLLLTLWFSKAVRDFDTWKTYHEELQITLRLLAVHEKNCRRR